MTPIRGATRIRSREINFAFRERSTPRGTWCPAATAFAQWEIYVPMGHPCSSDVDCAAYDDTTSPGLPGGGAPPPACYSCACTPPATGTTVAYTLTYGDETLPDFSTCCAGAGWFPNPPKISHAMQPVGVLTLGGSGPGILTWAIHVDSTDVDDNDFTFDLSVVCDGTNWYATVTGVQYIHTGDAGGPLYACTFFSYDPVTTARNIPVALGCADYKPVGTFFVPTAFEDGSGACCHFSDSGGVFITLS